MRPSVKRGVKTLFLKIGHRGAAGHKLENSIASFNYAKSKNIRAIELDVQLTKDGVPIIMHDKLLDRTTNSTGFVREITYKDLNQNVLLRNGERIPTLEEILDIFKNTNKVCYIEIIDEKAIKSVIELIKIKQMVSNTVISSFIHLVVQKVKQQFPEFRTMILFEGSPINTLQLVHNSNADEVGLGFESISTKVVSELLDAQIPVYAWTVNDPREIEFAKQMGLSGIFTDYLN